MNWYKNKKSIIGIIILLLLISFFWDENLFLFVQKLRFGFLDRIMLFITDFGMFFLAILLALYLINKKRWEDALLIIICPLTVFLFALLLKFLFGTPRPYEILDVIPVKYESFHSFPSMHAAFALSLFSVYKEIFNRKAGLFLGICLLFAFSRVYIGVHFFSDIIGGGLLGYLFSIFLINKNRKYSFLKKVIWNYQTKLEYRRQTLHTFAGLSIVLLLYFQLLNAEILFIFIIFGGIFSFLSRKTKIPIIHKFLLLFDRETDINTFPGKGSFYLVMGSFFTVLLFPLNTAMAAITIMALGDSISVIVGKYFGHITHPFNRKRNIEGLLSAILLSTIGAMFFVSPLAAFVSSFTAMFFESFTIKIKGFEIDDNVLVPLLAATVLYVFF